MESKKKWESIIRLFDGRFKNIKFRETIQSVWFCDEAVKRTEWYRSVLKIKNGKQEFNWYEKDFFANNLKYLRTKKGLEQKEISDFLGLKSPTSVTNWEKGTNLARAGHLSKLASLFGVSLHDLMEKDLSSVDDSHNITILYDQLNPARKTMVYDFITEQLKEQNNEI